MHTTISAPDPQRTSQRSMRRRRSRVERAMARLASWRILVVSALLLTLFAAVFFASSAPFAIPTVEETCGAAPLDVRFYSTSNQVNDFLADCGEEGRDAYRNMQIADFFYPSVFGLFLASALTLTLTRLFPQRPDAVALAAIALAGSALDYLENVFAWIALTSYPNPTLSNSLLGFASAAKTMVFWAAGAGLVVGVAALALRAVRHRAAGPTRQLG
ncbi:MAG: hypothetical protein ACR2QO_22530 [Acidimicrobiales bacterium]